MEGKTGEKKAVKKLSGLAFGDLHSAINNMTKISQAEEYAMFTAAFFAKVFSKKKSGAGSAKQLSIFVFLLLGVEREEEVKMLVNFLNRYLGFETKRQLVEAVEKVDSKTMDKLVELGFVKYLK